MAGKLLKSALIVGAAASFAVLLAPADLADASGGRVQDGPKLLLAPQIVLRARAVAPGDRIERTIVLRVRGRGELTVVGISVETTRASLLTDRRQGLRFTLERCSSGWRGTARAHSYRCRETRTRLIDREPVLGRRKLSLLLRQGDEVYLRLKLTLPTEAGNAFKHQASTLVYRFTAVTPTKP